MRWTNKKNINFFLLCAATTIIDFSTVVSV